MIKKILAVAHQIGGANTLSPVIKKLENIENLNISVIGYDFSAEGFSDYKIKYNLPESYDFYNKKDPLKSAEKILEFEQPDLLLCGSSNGFNLEKAMVVQCNRKAIPSIGVLDNWTNLELRFSENKDSTDFVYLPDKLAIMDKHTENDLKAKIDGMESYEFERRVYPHPRSPKALRIIAQKNGLIVGKMMCEVFVIIRMVD